MNPRELREQVGFLVSQCSDKTILTEVQVNAYVFQAMQHAALETRIPHLRSSTTMDLSASQRYMPTDVLKVLSVEALIAGSWTPLRRVSREKAVEYSGMISDTAFWYPEGVETVAGADRGKTKFTPFPPPTSTTVDGLRVAYLRKPAKLSTLAVTDEIIDFPEFFHLALAYEAAWLYLSRQGVKSYKDFSGYHQYYLNALSEMNQHFNEENSFDSHGYQMGVEWGGPNHGDYWSFN